MGFCRQLRTLIWRNWLIKKRLWGTTLAEILVPVIIMLLMVALRSAVSKTDTSLDYHVRDGITLNPAQQATFISTYKNRVLSLAFIGNTAVCPGGAAMNGDGYNVAPACPPGTLVDDFITAYPVFANRVIVFTDDAHFDAYCKDAHYGTPERPYIYAGVSVTTMGSVASPVWEYALRFNTTRRDGNNDNMVWQSEGPTSYDLQIQYFDNWSKGYAKFGFMWMQDFVERWMLKKSVASSPVAGSHTLRFQPFPVPPYQKDTFADIIGGVLGLLFTLTYIWPVTRIVKSIVEEKETRIKEALKIMGTRDIVIWLSWLITYAIVFFITALLITAVTAASLYPHSNKGYIVFLYWMFGLCVFTFGYLMSVFFSRAKTASSVAALLFLGSFFGYYAIAGQNNPDTPKGTKMTASISCTIAFALGASTVSKLESSGQGVTSASAGTAVENVSYNDVIGMLIIDFFLYLVFGLYFDRIVPSEWGTSLPPYYLCMPSFWCPPPPADRLLDDHDNEKSGAIEDVPADLKERVTIQTKQLRKEFPAAGANTLPRIAVRGLSCDMYSGQIFALLGHNGAGKTTVINMLTGMLPPTSGTAMVLGYRINDQMPLIRAHIGYCPQHDVLYDLLTVQEHLQMYAALKNVDPNKVNDDVKSMISEIGLDEKTHAPASALSGGMKRKLSLGIAFMGNTKVVVLDEPTTGMDPAARRHAWDMLNRKKLSGCTIILTTHFMDEADQLGDRIGIMANGDLKCCGSSLFLKNLYGVGYTLTLQKRDGFDEKSFGEVMSKQVPTAELLSHIAGEIAYRLPFRSSPAFPDLFEYFDAHRDELKISSYGVSVTTLEEVFLRVGLDNAPNVGTHVQKGAMVARSAAGATPQTQQRAPTPSQDRGAPATSVNGASILITVQPAPEGKMPAPVPAPAASAATGAMLSVAVESPAPAGISPSPVVPSGEYKNGAGSVELPTLSPGSGGSTMPMLGGMPSSSVGPTAGSNGHSAVRPHDRNDLVANFRAVHIESGYTWTHLRAMFIKRWHNAKRDRRVWTWTLAYPFLIALVGIGALTLRPGSLKSLAMDTKQWNTPLPVPYDIASTNGVALAAMSTGAGTNPWVFAAQLAVNSSSVMASATAPFLGLQNMSDWLITHRTDYKESMYVAFQADFAWTGPGTYDDAAIVFFNTTGYHALPVALNLLNSATLRYATGNPNAIIKLNNWPLHMTATDQVFSNSIVAVIFAIAFGFIPAAMVAYVVKEEADKVKHQHFISGVKPWVYWTANLAWDYCNFLVPGLLAVLVLAIWNIEETIGGNAGVTVLAVFLYGLAVIPFAYITSFFFSNHTSAQNITLIFFIFSGSLLLIASIVLDVIEDTKSVNSHLKYIYRLIPSFCFGECIANLIVREAPAAFGEIKSRWDMDISGKPMIFMAWESIAFFAIVLLIEHVRATPALLNWLRPPVNVADDAIVEDVDVVAERERVTKLESEGKREMIHIAGLRKVYAPTPGMPPHRAVANLYLGIPEGQCFGYLGVNGAGKTTTLKMLTGDVIPTSGSAFLAGLNIMTQQHELRHLLGYCPQFDSLCENLTAREHLVLYARIKGVPEADVFTYAAQMIDRLGLQEGIADKPCGGYSGGNKRKLCVGISLIGNPPIVFLDEPSSGMDPVSRRSMWDLISSTMRGRSVVLTTHSMEECEALCARIGIMVNGRLQCLGSAQHLKSRYGVDYMVDVTVPSARRAEFEAFMNEQFPGNALLETHGEALKFKVLKTHPAAPAGAPQLSFATIFRLMEHNQRRFEIREYSVSQATLEQVFLQFAKKQKPEDDRKAP